MKHSVLYILSLSLLFSCTNSPKNISFPENETEFEKPVVKKLGQVNIIKVNPVIIPIGKNRPDSIMPTIIANLGRPKNVPFISNEKKISKPYLIPFKQPDTIFYFNELSQYILRKKYQNKTLLNVSNPLAKKVKPKIVILGQPDKILCKPAQTADNAITNLKFYTQDQGLVATIVQCMCYDRNGNLWVGTDGGLCKFDGKEWWIYTVSQGLSNNYVFKIQESKDGNLIIGTDGGGLNILDYRNQTIKIYNQSNGLSSNYITCLSEMPDGKLFIGTAGGGLNILENQQVKCYNTSNGLSKNYVRSLLISKNDNIIIGTSGGGFNILNQTEQTIKQYSKKQGISDNLIFSMIEDHHGNLYFGTDRDGLYVIPNNSFTNINNQFLKRYTIDQGLSNNGIYCLLENLNGDIVIGTDGSGLNILDEKRQRITEYSNIHGLNHNTVFSLLESREGNLLIGTDGGGINILDIINQNLLHYNQSQGLSNSYVMSIHESKDGSLLIATSGGGMNILDKSSKTFSHYGSDQGINEPKIISVIETNDDKILLGAEVGGVLIIDRQTNKIINYTTSQGINSDYILSLLESRNGNILIGTYGSGLNILDEKRQQISSYKTDQGLSNNYVYTIKETHDGKFLIGTDGGGLNILEFKNGNQEQILKHFGIVEGLNNNYILSVLENSDGDYLIGTDGGGLNLIDNKKQLIKHYSLEQGLPNSKVFSIAEDSLGNIWLGTGKGLCKMIHKNGEYIVQKKFDKREGLMFMDFNPNAMYITKKGKLWAGIGDILTEFNPYVRIDTLKPFTFITNVSVMEKNDHWFTERQILQNLNSSDTVWSSNQESFFVNRNLAVDTSYFIKNKIQYNGVSKDIYHLPLNLVLPFKQNHLTFDFTGICISANADKIRYRYILDGLDDNWSPITEKSEADYRNIPPGNYVFKIAARSANGYWSSPVTFAFEVLAPWYQTKWAIMLYIIFLVGSIFGFTNWRTHQLKVRQKALELKIDEATLKIRQQKDLVEEQKYLIEEKHKEITDSINYAERIQKSFLATKSHLDSYLSEYFILFQPKDVVSGDFYWSSTLNDGKFILATADSTGHGVPGAIMSLLNITSLEKAIETHKEPSDILNATRKIIIERLKNDGSSEGGKDGMDCSIIIFNKEKTKLTYAAANNPVWIIRDKTIIELPADKMPLGKHDKQDVSFSQNEISLQKGDIVYTLTDGLPDQFGGPRGKKFMYKQLKELLINISNESMEKQKEMIELSLNNWKGLLEQVDDITLVGIRI